MHTEGEPLRILTEGIPDLPGTSILEKRRAASEQFDWVRKTLMAEPRGHRDMYGCILTPPVDPESDLGVIFLHNEGYSTMCGHGIIGLATAVLETGMLPCREPETSIRIDTPAGLVTARARVKAQRVQSVAFENVPSFVIGLDQNVKVPGIGNVRFDLAFGGAFYVFVDASSLGLTLKPEAAADLVAKGIAIKIAVMEHFTIRHPFESDLGFLYGTIFTGPPRTPDADSRNVCIFADGQVDRSPTGTGVSARMAIGWAREQIGLDRPVFIESIIGSRFSGRVKRTLRFGPYDAVIPEVEGRAFFTGRHEFWLDPDDPLAHGFLVV